MKNIHLLDFNLETDDCVLYYNLQFDEKTSFPKVLECIRMDKELHVQLQFSGNPLTLTIGLYVEQMQNCLDLEC